MVEETQDPVERLARVIREADVRMPDTERARGAQGLVERLRRETGAARGATAPNPWRRGLVWSSVALVAAAILLVAFWPRGGAQVARVELPNPPKASEQIVPPSQNSVDRTVLEILRPMGQSENQGGRARLETRPGEELRAWLSDCGRVVLRAMSALAVEENAASGISLHLERGMVLVSFDHDSGRGLTVRTRDAVVRVTGTLFAVATGDGPTRVSVSRGSVEVAAGGLPVSVSAGKTWQVGAASLGAPDPGTALALRELRDLEAPSPVAGPTRAAPVGGTLGEIALKGTKPQAAPNEGPPLGAGEQPERAAETIYRAAEDALAAGRTAAGKGILESLVADHPHDPLVVPATYELARLAFRAKDYARSGEQLRKVRDSQQAAAALFREPAAFLLCRAELESGERQAGLTCLEHFRSAFPESPHIGDALALLATLRLGDKDCKQGSALAQEYLRRFPNGAHAQRLREATRECR